MAPARSSPLETTNVPVPSLVISPSMTAGLAEANVRVVVPVISRVAPPAPILMSRVPENEPDVRKVPPSILVSPRYPLTASRASVPGPSLIKFPLPVIPPARDSLLPGPTTTSVATCSETGTEIVWLPSSTFTRATLLEASKVILPAPAIVYSPLLSKLSVPTVASDPSVTVLGPLVNSRRFATASSPFGTLLFVQLPGSFQEPPSGPFHTLRCPTMIVPCCGTVLVPA